MADRETPSGTEEILKKLEEAEALNRLEYEDIRREKARYLGGGVNGFPWYSSEMVREELRIVEQTRIPTGIPFLDRAFGGGLPGATVVALVGPPGSCKSALAIQLGLARARATSKRLYVYSPDQGGLQPLGRLAGRYGDILGNDPSFTAYCAEVGDLVRVADERARGVTLDSFRDALLAAGDVGAVVIDTPQTVETKEDLEERAQIDFTMETARLLAGKLIVPVFVPSHANRAATAARRREDRNAPRSAALGSAKVEHRSQVVIFMEEVEDTPEERREVNVELPKVSFGNRAGKARLRLDPAAWRLAEIDRAEMEEEDREKKVIEDRKLMQAIGEEIMAELRKATTGLSGNEIQQLVKGRNDKHKRAAIQWLYHEQQAIYPEKRKGRGGGIIWKAFPGPASPPPEEGETP